VLHLHKGEKAKWVLAPRRVNTQIPCYWQNVGILTYRSQTFYFLCNTCDRKTIFKRADLVRKYSTGRLTPEELKVAVANYNIDTIVIDKKYIGSYLHNYRELGFVKTYENSMYIVMKR
jgi:hypothetical protein